MRWGGRKPVEPGGFDRDSTAGPRQIVGWSLIDDQGQPVQVVPWGHGSPLTVPTGCYIQSMTADVKITLEEIPTKRAEIERAVTWKSWRASP